MLVTLLTCKSVVNTRKYDTINMAEMSQSTTENPKQNLSQVAVLL